MAEAAIVGGPGEAANKATILSIRGHGKQQQQQMSSLYAQNQVNAHHINSGSQLQSQFQSQTSSYPYHQPRTLEEVKTLWIGDLQYWMEENYVQSCFAHTNEVGLSSISPSLPLSFSVYV